MPGGDEHPFQRERLRADHQFLAEMALCDEYKIPHSVFLGWSAEDRSKALAYRYEKAERCTMCGTASWEWEENPRAYMVEEHHCMGCYIRHVSNEDQHKLPGTTIELVRQTPQRVAKQAIMDARRRRMSKEE